MEDPDLACDPTQNAHRMNITTIEALRRLYASPREVPPGFVKIRDATTLLNPGVDETLRINGAAAVSHEEMIKRYAAD